MNCAKHPDVEATAYCRTCGKALCQACQRTAQGTIFCEEHFAPAAPGVSGASSPYSPYTSPYTVKSDPGASPGLAFLLGLIPGVGAIYNGQYAKGLVHVVILGLLISIISSDAAGSFAPVFGMLIAAWYLYMPFEAYHTARKKQMGEALDEWSSIMPMKRSPGFPVGPVILIVIGVIFLLNTLEIVRLYQIMRWWPIFLILLGVYMLYARMTGGVPVSPASTEEAPHER